ncbi:MAG: GFA family protein [Myxococcota bacterium]|nr:GFA family protein [Myxococcota bacterium]
MKVEGGCYCGAVRYEAEGDPLFKGLCYCRECQHVSGGGANVVMAVPESGFRYTKGQPKSFRRSDLESPANREFCGECGTHLATRSPSLPGGVMLKVGSLDDPAAFGMPQMAIFTAEKREYHVIPEGVRAFDRMPG